MKLHPILRWLLWPGSALYGFVARFRTALYRRGILKQRRLRGVVISVGNLTVGGTGKTPLVQWIAGRLLDEGKRVGILTRGYKGAGSMSDEVALLQSRLGRRAHFGVGPDRFQRGHMLERHGIEWFVLDDGFQHLRLARDADVLLLDSTNAFGGGWLLPAGPLREPRSALARADIIVITRTDHAPALETVVRHHSSAPIFYAQATLDGVFAHPQSAAPASAEWKGKKYFAFCGIGNPAAFSNDLRRWGFDVVGEASFPDHHRYSQQDIDDLARRASSSSADALLCTEKDIFNLIAVQPPALPLHFCRISLVPALPELFWQTLFLTIARNRERGRP